jgi:hypothetical protein
MDMHGREMSVSGAFTRPTGSGERDEIEG